MLAKKIVMAMVLMVSFGVVCWAQLDGNIEGVVKDRTGALVPSAMITITSVETGAQRTLISDDRGHFIATLLPIGTYDVRLELAGFKTAVQRVLVKSAETASLNLVLEVGGRTEEISVTEAAVLLLNVSDAQLSMSIDEKRIKELPLSTRDPLALATLSPGVVPVTAANPFLGTAAITRTAAEGDPTISPSTISFRRTYPQRAAPASAP